jgi:transposase
MITASRQVENKTRPGEADTAGFKTNPLLQLTDAQWLKIAKYFPDKSMTTAGGRPPRSNRDCFEGILYVLLTGTSWKKLPTCFPSESVCRKRFKKWIREGKFLEAWKMLLQELDQLGQLDLETLIADGTFAPANWLSLACIAKPGGFGR